MSHLINKDERGEWKAGLKLNIQKTKIMASGPITSWQIEGEKVETVTDFTFLGYKPLRTVTAAMKLKDVCSLEKSYDKPRQYIKKQRHHLANKSPYSQNYGFSSSHVWMWELDHKQDWAPKNWCFRTMVIEKTLESPLDSKKIKPANPKGNQPWIFIGRTEAEAPILQPSDVKNWLTGKDPDTGKDWRKEEKGTEDEMVGCNHWLSEHEFEPTPWDSDGQGSQACCSSWGCRVQQDFDWIAVTNRKLT